MRKMHQKRHSLTERSDVRNDPISHCVIIDDMGIEYIAARDSMKYLYIVVFILATYASML